MLESNDLRMQQIIVDGNEKTVVKIRLNDKCDPNNMALRINEICFECTKKISDLIDGLLPADTIL